MSVEVRRSGPPLALEPRLLLLDEPLGALDLPLRATLVAPREVAAHAARTLAMRAGRFEGTA
jgi:ABC-type sulfate/molybdate transport systems ATPase subunit